MSDLSTASVAVLSTFRHAPKNMLSVKKLCRLLPDAAAYEYRVGELINAGLIEPCRWEPRRTVNGVFFSGAATAFRLTVKGSDYLSALDQQRKNRAKKNKQQKEDHARAKKQHAEDLRYDRHTAIIAAIVGAVTGSVLTLLIEHFDQLIVWVQSLLLS